MGRKTREEAGLRRAYSETEQLLREADPGTPADIRVPELRDIFELDVAPADLDEIAAAAEAVGVEVDAFIVAAALDKARGAAPSRGALAEARAKARELEDALRRL